MSIYYAKLRDVKSCQSIFRKLWKSSGKLKGYILSIAISRKKLIRNFLIHWQFLQKARKMQHCSFYFFFGRLFLKAKTKTTRFFSSFCTLLKMTGKNVEIIVLYLRVLCCLVLEMAGSWKKTCWHRRKKYLSGKNNRENSLKGQEKNRPFSKEIPKMAKNISKCRLKNRPQFNFGFFLWFFFLFGYTL